MRIKLTEPAVRRLSTKKTQEDFWDKDWRWPGSFGMRVSKTGTKTWQYIEIIPIYAGGRQADTKRKRHTLGRWPMVDLDQALQDAERIARIQASGAATVADIARYELDKLEANEQASHHTVTRRRSILDGVILPAIGHMRARDVLPHHLQTLVDGAEHEQKFAKAADIHATARWLFRNSVRLGHTDRNPAIDLALTKRDRRRLVEPSAEALAKAWTAAGQLVPHYLDQDSLAMALQCLAVQFQIATWQRADAILCLYRDHVVGDWWEHPGSFTVEHQPRRGKTEEREYHVKGRKNRPQPTYTPITSLGREPLSRAMGIHSGPWVFSASELPHRSWHMPIIRKIRRRAGLTAKQWRPHDARSIGQTLMDWDDWPRDHTQRVLTHSRPRGTDTRFYLVPKPHDPAKRRVLDAWGDKMREALSQVNPREAHG